MFPVCSLSGFVDISELREIVILALHSAKVVSDPQYILILQIQLFLTTPSALWMYQ